jgi:hypothetical protein
MQIGYNLLYLVCVCKFFSIYIGNSKQPMRYDLCCLTSTASNEHAARIVACNRQMSCLWDTCVPSATIFADLYGTVSHIIIIRYLNPYLSAKLYCN